MDVPTELLLKIYGQAGIVVAVSLLWVRWLITENKTLKGELRDERLYIRDLEKTTRETLDKLENTVRSWLERR